MANVYSKLLYRVNPASSGTIYTSPAGFVTDVRMVTFYNPGSSFAIPWAGILAGIELYQTTTAARICGVMGRDARPLRYYFFNLRHIINAGETLSLATADGGWSVYISGYQLTLP